MDVNRREILDRLLARMRALNMDWGDLAASIDRIDPNAYEATRQAVENWKKRGVPPEKYSLVARALGWTQADLIGESSPAGDPGGWPFEVVPRDRFERLSEAERLMAQAAMLQKIEELEQSRREKNAPPRTPGSNPHSGRSRKSAP